jgi:hypothetical protein
MASNTYPLHAMVSFLEAALSVSGRALPDAASSSRKALKKRLCKLRHLSEQLHEKGVWSASATSAPVVTTRAGNVTARPTFMQGSYAVSTRVVSLCTGGYDIDEALAGWTAPPFLGDTRATELDVALRIERDGPQSFFESVMAYWERRHQVTAKAASPDKRPRRRLALDRLFLALMRFILGFFGSHKVDARNNP